MFIRMFMIDKAHGTLIARSSAQYRDPVSFMQSNAQIYPHRVYLAWEDSGMAVSSQLESVMYARCRTAIEAGRALRIDASQLLDEWAKAKGIVVDVEAHLAKPAPAASPAAQSKPRTVIVQEWIEDQDKADLARRAWAATMNLCGDRRSE